MKIEEKKIKLNILLHCLGSEIIRMMGMIIMILVLALTWMVIMILTKVECGA